MAKYMLRFKGFFSLALLAPLLGCSSYYTEFKDVHGIDANRLTSVRCSGAGSNLERDKSELDCAKLNSGKLFVEDDFLFYSEVKKDDEARLVCVFAGYDKSLVMERMKSGVGLVQPLLMIDLSGNVVVDEKSTNRLIAALKGNLKLNVKPYADSKEYLRILSGARLQRSPWGPVDPDLHYRHVISKFSGIDYFISVSDKLSEIVMLDGVNYLQKNFTAANEESRKLNGEALSLEMKIGAHQEAIALNNSPPGISFLLIDRLKNAKSKSMFSINSTVESESASGCFYKRLNEYREYLKDKAKLDSFRNLGKIEEKRMRLHTKVADHTESMRDRHDAIVNDLVPFLGVSFKKFQVTGYIKSKPLK